MLEPKAVPNIAPIKREGANIPPIPPDPSVIEVHIIFIKTKRKANPQNI